MKKKTINVRVPKEMEDEIREVARLAKVKPETVIKLALTE